MSSRRATTDDGVGEASLRRGLRRLLGRGDDRDRSSRRAGGGPFPAITTSPRVWVALG